MGRDGGDAVNGNAEFAEASDMMSDHTLPLPVVQRRCLSVVERLAFFEHLIDQEQHDMCNRNEGGCFLTTRSTGQTPELIFEKTVLGGRCRPRRIR